MTWHFFWEILASGFEWFGAMILVKWGAKDLPRVSQPHDSNPLLSNLCRRDLHCRHLQSSGGEPRAADEFHVEMHSAGDPCEKLGMSLTVLRHLMSKLSIYMYLP